MAWILTLWANPLARKIIIYAGVIAGILLCLRWYGNRQWYKGEMQGRRNIAASIEKAKQAEWKTKEAAIAVDAANIITEKRAITAATEQLSKDRITINRSLKDSLAGLASQTATKREEDHAIVNSLASDQLDDAIRDRAKRLGPAQ